jgi:hypothetical protein
LKQNTQYFNLILPCIIYVIINSIATCFYSNNFLIIHNLFLEKKKNNKEIKILIKPWLYFQHKFATHSIPLIKHISLIPRQVLQKSGVRLVFSLLSLVLCSLQINTLLRFHGSSRELSYSHWQPEFDQGYVVYCTSSSPSGVWL